MQYLVFCSEAYSRSLHIALLLFVPLLLHWALLSAWFLGDVPFKCCICKVVSLRSIVSLPSNIIATQMLYAHYHVASLQAGLESNISLKHKHLIYFAPPTLRNNSWFLQRLLEKSKDQLMWASRLLLQTPSLKAATACRAKRQSLLLIAQAKKSQQFVRRHDTRLGYAVDKPVLTVSRDGSQVGTRESIVRGRLHI